MCEHAAAGKVFDGRNGLVLLSRYPLIESDYLAFSPHIAQHGALYAKINSTPVFCTHLTAPKPSVLKYRGLYQSWEDDQYQQIKLFLQWVTEKTKNQSAIVLGDMNTGLGIAPKIQAQLPNNFEIFIAADFVDPYLNTSSPQCTVCEKNALQIIDTEDLIIDHIFLFNADYNHKQLSIKRVFDTPIEIVNNDKTIKTDLSDHYGLELVID